MWKLKENYTIDIKRRTDENIFKHLYDHQYIYIRFNSNLTQ